MAIKFGNNTTQKYASTVVASYYSMVTSTYSIQGPSNIQTVWTGSNRSLPGTDCEHIIHAKLEMAGRYGGAYRLEYSTDGGSNWNDVSTIGLGSNDNGSGMNGKAFGSYHLNLDGHGTYMLGTGPGLFWKYDPASTQSRFRIRMSPYEGTNVMTFNRRQYDTSFNSISHIIEYVVQDT